MSIDENQACAIRPLMDRVRIEHLVIERLRPLDGGGHCHLGVVILGTRNVRIEAEIYDIQAILGHTRGA